MALDAIEQLLVANHGFTVTPEGAVVSPGGRVRNVVDGKTVFTPYTPPTTGPTFAEQFAAQQAQAIAQTNQVRQDEAIASGSDTYQSMAPDGTVTNVSTDTPVTVGQPAQAITSDSSSISPAPTQTREELESALADAQDLDLEGAKRFKNTTSDLTGVKYKDKTAFEYDLGEEYDNVVAVRSGNSVKFYKDGERVGSDVLGIDSLGGESGNDKIKSLFNQLRDQEVQEVYDQFGGQEGALVSEYLADEAAAERARQKKDERSDERDQERFDALRNQVKKEADALNISTDDYYKLGFPLRAQMAISDIGELFTEKPGDAGYFALVGPDGQPVDKDGNPVDFGGLGLGTLGSENLAIYQDKAQKELDEKLGPVSSDIPSGLGEDSGITQTNLAPYMEGVSGQPVPLAGGLNIPGTGLTITAGDAVGPGAGSNTGGGGTNVGGGGDTGGADAGGGTGGGGDTGIGVIDPIGGGGTGTGGGTSPTGIRESAYGLTLDDVLVPSTVNYGTDPRFANLAPKFNVSEATMPSFSGLPITPPEEETALLAQGGIVSLAGGGTPKGVGITPDFMIDYYNNSLIPRALDGDKVARDHLLEAHKNFSNFTLPEELFLKVKYGRANGGVASLSDTARNMFRPMVS